MYLWRHTKGYKFKHKAKHSFAKLIGQCKSTEVGTSRLQRKKSGVVEGELLINLPFNEDILLQNNL